jgi:hypothetical protein
MRRAQSNAKRKPRLLRPQARQRSFCAPGEAARDE